MLNADDYGKGGANNRYKNKKYRGNTFDNKVIYGENSSS